MAFGKHGKVSGEERKGLKVLVTGASGFIGSHLLPVLAKKGFEVLAASRKNPVPSDNFEWRAAPELGPDGDWSPTLREADAVVHLAGRAQIGKETAAENKLCLRINAEGTRVLARQAARGGIKHFILLSSCHAVAAESDDIIASETPPKPCSAYGRSKLAAEGAVRQELNGSSSRWTILRPPPVYGPGSQSNFSSLLKLVEQGVPLPLASVHNRRSFLYVENLADLIALCLGNAKAFGKIFYPNDGEDLSTPELLRAIASANDSVQCSVPSDSVSDKATRRASLETRHSARIFPFPQTALKTLGLLPGFGALHKLTSSLYVDGESIRRELGWTPRFKMEEGFRRTLSRD